MDVRQIETAIHAAWLDVDTGCGIALLPLPGDDVWINPGSGIEKAAVASVSLLDADLQAFVLALAREGWAITEDDDGLPMHAGIGPCGREAVGLVAMNCAEVELEDLIEADSALRVLLGVRPDPRDS